MKARKPSAATIRALYPHPTTSENGAMRDTAKIHAHGGPLPEHERSYCVGGAVLRYADSQLWKPRFPSVGHIMDALLSLNPKLSKANAEMHARHIINLNDARRFSEAWQEVDKALTGGRSNGS